MKCKRILFVLLFVCLTLSASACSKLTTPDNTLKPPSYNQNDNIMNDYRDLINRNSSPGEILEFIEANIGNLSKEDADTVVLGYLDVQKKKLENYQEKLMSQEINAKINSYPYDDVVNNKNITDDDIKVLLQNAFSDGFKISSSEGMYYFEMDYGNLKSKFSGFVSESTSAYLSIKGEENKKHFAEDGALIISWDELAARVVNTESFIEKYKNSPFLKEIKELHSWYLPAYLMGLNNTPAYSYEDKAMKQEVIDSYKNTLEKYKDSNLAKLLGEYTTLIEKNNFKMTQEVQDFAHKAVASPEK